MSLNISDKVKLPLTFVTSKHAILAKSRVGKSYTAQVMAEELLKADQQVLVLDPTSAWWGLRSHHDGDKPGLPIAVFGGDHGDAELPPGSGKEMARAAVAEGFSAIFDLSNLEPDEMVQWAMDFGSVLYHRDGAREGALPRLGPRRQGPRLRALLKRVLRGPRLDAMTCWVEGYSGEEGAKVWSEIQKIVVKASADPNATTF